MKTTIKLLIFVLVFLAMTASSNAQAVPGATPVVVRAQTPEQVGDEKVAAGQYADAIFYYKTQWASFMAGRNDGDADTLAARERLAGKLAAAVAKMDKPPAIPEEAEFHASKGTAFVKLAKTPADFAKAVKEFQDAINIAPWLFDYHFNLAVAYKSAGQFKFALNSLTLAKLLATNEKDRRDANGLRAEIEAAQEMAVSANAEAEKFAAENTRQAAIKARERRFEGNWYRIVWSTRVSNNVQIRQSFSIFRDSAGNWRMSGSMAPDVPYDMRLEGGGFKFGEDNGGRIEYSGSLSADGNRLRFTSRAMQGTPNDRFGGDEWLKQ